MKSSKLILIEKNDAKFRRNYLNDRLSKSNTSSHICTTKSLKMNVQAKIKDKVLKPVSDVFDAIINPGSMSNYFISSSSGYLKANETVTWSFSDVGGRVEVQVNEFIENELIVFEWSASGATANVTIKLESIDEGSTSILIIEDGWPFNETGVKKALQQTQGWTDFICSMKAWLYCGINLRLGRAKGTY